MAGTLKRVARSVSPAPVRRAWGQLYGRVKIRRARKVFERNGVGNVPAFLSADELSTLMNLGYQPPDVIRYDPGGLVERADQKLKQITRALDLTGVRTSLELGCWDGMVAAALATRGMTAVGLDMTSQGLDRRAREAGARFVQSDAEAIALGSESIDLVYYRQIPVPFCHLLFREEDLHRWAAEHNLPHAWPFVNGWTLKQYRALWRSLELQFVVTDYRESTTGGVGVELVNRYPRCFKDHVDDFDELLVAFVDLTLRKR